MISVIIPTHNRRRQVRTAIQSVLAQEGVEFELIVVDDGSEEDLSEVEALVRSAGHQFLRQSRQGVAAARNYASGNAAGDYLAFLDSDDVWMPQKLALQQEYHAEHPAIRISQCQERWIRKGVFVNQKKYHEMRGGDIFALSVERCMISPSSVIMERALFKELGGFDERFWVCEDYELWLRISSQYQVGLLEVPLVEKFGGHEDQLSRSVIAIDRYRVAALVKCAMEIDLSSEQATQVAAGILRLSDILYTGGKKHGRSWTGLFADLADDVENLSDTTPEILRATITPYWNDLLAQLSDH